jgi:hypothetical protein
VLDPYSVEQADPDPRRRRGVGIKRGTAFWRIGTFRTPSGSNVPLRAFSPAGARALFRLAWGGILREAISIRSFKVARPAGAQPVRRINLYVKLTAPHSKRKFWCGCLSSSKRFDDRPASKLPSARGFSLEHDGLASDQGGFRAAPFCLALVNRGRDAAWAKSYGSIG